MGLSYPKAAGNCGAISACPTTNGDRPVTALWSLYVVGSYRNNARRAAVMIGRSPRFSTESTTHNWKSARLAEIFLAKHWKSPAPKQLCLQAESS